MHIGLIIRDARKRLGLSQEELGEKLRITGQAVSQWERGETEPNQDNIPLLAKTLELPISALLPAFTEDLPAELITLWKKLPTKEARERALHMLRLFTEHAA